MRENELPIHAFKSYHIYTACECMHLVTCGHFRSRDKEGGNTTRSAIARIGIFLPFTFASVILTATR